MRTCVPEIRSENERGIANVIESENESGRRNEKSKELGTEKGIAYGRRKEKMKENVIENALSKENVIGLQQRELRPGTQRSGLQCRKLFLGMHVVPLCGGMHNIVKHQLGFLFYLCHALHLECRGFYVASSQDTNLISVIPEGVLHQLGQYGEIMSAR